MCKFLYTLLSNSENVPPKGPHPSASNKVIKGGQTDFAKEVKPSLFINGKITQIKYSEDSTKELQELINVFSQVTTHM